MKKNRSSLITLLCAAAMLAGAPTALAFQDAAPPTITEATGLMQAGHFEDAAAAFQQVLESDPDNATAWFNLGYSLHMAGHLDQALRAHRKAATYEQFEGIALYNVACALALTGNTDGALEALTASRLAGFDRIGSADTDSDLDSIRDDQRYEIAMGRAEAPAGHVIVQNAAPARPQGSVLSPQELAAARQRLPQLFQTVAEHLQPILEDLSPQIERAANELMQHAMGKAQQLAGQLQQMVMEDDQLVSAIEEIHHTLTNDPEFMAMVGEAQQWIQQRMGGASPQAMKAPAAAQVQTPVEDVEHAAVTPMPTLSDAQQLQQSGRHAEAAHAFAHILHADPHNAAAAFGYAYNLHMSGAHEEAIAAHKAAAEFDQFHGISLYNLGCAYALTGRSDAAIEALRAAVEAGFDVAAWIHTDSDLDSLREDPRFIQLVRDLSDG